MIRKITLFLVLILSFSQELLSCRDCRNPDEEGWAWGGPSLGYEHTRGKVDFSGIHDELFRMHKLAVDNIEETSKRKNVCVARLAFLVEGADQPEMLDLKLNRSYYVSGTEHGRNNPISLEGYTVYRLKDAYERFKNPHEISHRLCLRWSGQPAKLLPQKAKLARRWMEIHDKLDDQLIHWWNEASADIRTSFTSHFHTRNFDSEQKLLYDLHDMVESADETLALKRIIEDLFEKIEETTQNSKFFSLINSYMKERKMHDTHHNIFDTEGEPVALEEYQFTFEEHLESLCQLEGGLTDLQLRLKKSKLRHQINSLMFSSRKAGLLKITEETLEHLSEYKESKDFINIWKFLKKKKNSNALKISADLGSIEQYIKEKADKNTTILGFTLHLHNTYDSCFGCAPDIAQEARREDGFVSYVKSLVEKGQDTAPGFQWIVSYSKFRDDTNGEQPAWCSNYERTEEEHKLFSREGPVFLQHHLDITTTEEFGIEGEKGDSGWVPNE